MSSVLPASKAASDFTIHQESPLNAEPSASSLVVARGDRNSDNDRWITPVSHQYLRSHGDVLHLPREGYKLRLALPRSDLKSDDDFEEIEMSPDEMLDQLGRTQLDAALQCAGNRRAEMNARKEVEGIPWGAGTIFNAAWSGVSACEQSSEGYEASIPLSAALDPDRCVLLADEMDGAPLPPEHGGPLRVIVPGFIGARSVKWVQRISVSRQQSSNFYMTSDYKKLPEGMDDPDKKEEWMQKTEPLGETGLQSAIGSIEQLSSSSSSLVSLRLSGYAYDGRGRGVSRVRVCVVPDPTAFSQHDLISSAQQSSEWTDAQLQQGDDMRKGKVWSWTLWTADVPLRDEWRGREVGAVCCASAGDGEEQSPLGQWNIRGVEEDGWGQYRHFNCR